MMTTTSKILSTSRILAITFLLATFSSTTTNAKETCPSDCQPNGDCLDGVCVCDSGFAGLDCSFPFQICPGGVLACFDGARCMSVGGLDLELEDRQWQCDCSAAFDQSPFAIKECSNPESVACEEDKTVSDYAFCTNGGKCKDIVRNREPHAGCDCPKDFEGRHCQYAKGTAPAAELDLAKADKKRNSGNIADFFIAMIVLCVVGTFAYIVYKKTIGSPGTTTDDFSIPPPSGKTLDDSADADTSMESNDHEMA